MRLLRLPQVQNVGPIQRASIRLPLGYTYQKIYLQLGTNILTTLVTNIVLRLNNKEFQRWNSAADLISGLNGFKGNFIASNSLLVLDFTERFAREELGLTLGTVAATQEAGIQEFTLEFDLGVYTVGAGSTVVAWADVETPSANSIVQRVQVQQKTVAAAAEEQIYVPFGRNGYQVKRLIIKHLNLSSVRVRRDGVDVYENLPVALANQRLQDFGRFPQAGYHVLDFMPDALQSNAFNTAFVLDAENSPVPVENLDVRLTTSAADTLTIYTESYSSNRQL
jgi:hypothetical protein